MGRVKACALLGGDWILPQIHKMYTTFSSSMAHRTAALTQSTEWGKSDGFENSPPHHDKAGVTCEAP